MSSASTSTLASHPTSVSVNKRQDTLVASRAEFTILSNAGWEHQLSRSNMHGNSSCKKSSKKMKFPRRNSLNFPLSLPREETPVPEEEDPFTDLVKERSTNSSKSAFPISSEIKKALAVLSNNTPNTTIDFSDNNSLSATSAMSASTVSTSEDDEVVKVNELSKASAISTPVPQRKKALHIPTAKHKQMPVVSVSDDNDSPVSVTESPSFSPLSISEGGKKTKMKKSKSRDSSEKSSSKSRRRRDSSEKSSSKARDSSKKSSKTKSSSSKKSRKSSSRKQVHFQQTCTMRRTLSRKDMTTKELRRAWLSAEEYHRMQIRDEILADRVDAGRCKPGTCIRGLESKIEESAMKKLNLRVKGFEEVLIEQERQWDEAGDSPNFYYDFSAFEYVYGPVSEEALLAAQEVARQDRLEAEKILASDTPFRSKGLRSRFTRRRSWA